MAMAIRSPACITGWTCENTTECASRFRSRYERSIAAYQYAVAQAADFSGMSCAAGPSRLDGLPPGVGRKSRRIHHAFHGNLDAGRPVRDADGHAAAANPEAELADSLAADVRALCFLLRLPAFHHLGVDLFRI